MHTNFFCIGSEKVATWHVPGLVCMFLKPFRQPFLDCPDRRCPVSHVQRAQSSVADQRYKSVAIGIFRVPAWTTGPLGFDAEFLDNLVGVFLDLDRAGNPVPARRDAKRPDGGKFRQKQDS